MKHLVTIALLAALAGCAGMQQTPQQAMQSYCTVSVPEFAAVDSVKDQLDDKAAQLVAIATPLNAALCTPPAISAATPETVQQYLAQVLPAVTVLGIQLAAKHDAPASAAGATK